LGDFMQRVLGYKDAKDARMQWQAGGRGVKANWRAKLIKFGCKLSVGTPTQISTHAYNAN